MHVCIGAHILMDFDSPAFSREDLCFLAYSAVFGINKVI